MQQDTHHSPPSSAQVKNVWIKFLETGSGKQLWTWWNERNRCVAKIV